jgi:hypothetical protein
MKIIAWDRHKKRGRIKPGNVCCIDIVSEDTKHKTRRWKPLSYPDKRAAVCMYDDGNMYFEKQCSCRYNNERCCCVPSGKIECAFHPNYYHIGMEVIYYTYISNLVYEEFEDTNGSIIIRISTKTRQHNGQKKKNKRTNNYLQNIHIKRKIE